MIASALVLLDENGVQRDPRMDVMSRASRRVVLVSGPPCRGGRPQVWGYTVATIAELAGASPAVVRKAIREGSLDPTSVLAVADWIRKRRA